MQQLPLADQRRFIICHVPLLSTAVERIHCDQQEFFTTMP